MIDSGATEEFIDEDFCNKYQIQTIKAKNWREIYLADGESSSIWPVTHIATVPIDIGAHRELANFQVANLQNHQAILGMPWLKHHNTRIDWEQGRIICDSERCTTLCLKEPQAVNMIPEAEALEEHPPSPLHLRWFKSQHHRKSSSPPSTPLSSDTPHCLCLIEAISLPSSFPFNGQAWRACS